MNHRAGIALLSCIFMLLASACGRIAYETDSQSVERAVRAVMAAQQEAWNRGDIDGFMNGYARAATTTFVSGDDLTRGWQTVLDRYKQHYQSRNQMGTLTFSDLTIQSNGSNFAVADGRWQLTRASDSPHGRFTLIFQYLDREWRITHDTTTSAAP